MNYDYKIETAGPTFYAKVAPTMEALGDQPWHVTLFNEDGSKAWTRLVEECSGLQAAAEVALALLKQRKTTNTSIIISAI